MTTSPLPVNRTKGFTLLEMIVVVILISILFVYAVDRLLKLQAEAERVSVQMVIGNLQSALAMDIAEHVVKGKLASLHQRINSNPMRLLADHPVNYRGEFDFLRLDELQTGYWYFDIHSATLLYPIKNDETFSSSLEGPAHIQLRIDPVYDDHNSSREFEPETDTIKGLKLVFLQAFQWSGLEIQLKN